MQHDDPVCFASKAMSQTRTTCANLSVMHTWTVYRAPVLLALHRFCDDCLFCGFSWGDDEFSEVRPAHESLLSFPEVR